MNWEDAVESIKSAGLPYFCFDPEFINLLIVYDQFIFSANCAAIAKTLFVHDLTGCLDSGLL